MAEIKKEVPDAKEDTLSDRISIYRNFIACNSFKPARCDQPSRLYLRKALVEEWKLVNNEEVRTYEICEENETYKVPISDEYSKDFDLNPVQKRLEQIYDKILVVDDLFTAKKVVKKLTNEYKHLVHACDTEVANIDAKEETPVDHGDIICFSIYCGPEADFDNGKSCVWVDVLDGGGKDILDIFAPFFEDSSIKKVWHNYSFDNHIIENYGLKVSGFHADTMHMARLWDSSRLTSGGYSLEALTNKESIKTDDEEIGVKTDDDGVETDDVEIGKFSMKTIFGKRKLKKNGQEGKIVTIPPVEELQRAQRKQWICYSSLDSISTLKLYERLKRKLSEMSWNLDGGKQIGSMFDFYEIYWQPFGEVLVKMESEGMLVDRNYLAEIEKVAKLEQQIAGTKFRNWASKYCPDAKYMNVGSASQLRQLFYGGRTDRYDFESLPMVKEFKVPVENEVMEPNKKTRKKFRNIKLWNILSGTSLKPEKYTVSGWPSVSGDSLKFLAGKVSSEFDFVDTSENSEPSGEMSDYGTAYECFDDDLEGKEACHAIADLCQVSSIKTQISNFILPLQGSQISGKDGRIHCSLNINTETGRLSARRPSLQNQPALEKDRYKIRQAFIAAPGNSLIVADYEQLELRLLAHLADCQSMLDAFKEGGDFHSRTAMVMYPRIRKAVEQNSVLLEWHPKLGQENPPVPLLKDAFASERRKAKTLNFSIAYGISAYGLSRDWKVSVEEAQEAVDRWYSERQEVLRWQNNRKNEVRMNGRVHTLLGRTRCFPINRYASAFHRPYIERAAINTPIQCSAADVAMCAMLEISKNEWLKEMGWKMVLQVHDEVILEGPTESAEVARQIIVDCMSKPFFRYNFLKVDLSVSAKFATNWYAAK